MTMKKDAFTEDQLSKEEATNGGPVLLAERYQDNATAWSVACFGKVSTSDPQERVFRFFEEAAELAQSCGLTQPQALQLIGYAFSKERGEVAQEVGGVMLTLSSLCSAQGIDLQQAANDELRQVWGKVEKIRAKDLQKPAAARPAHLADQQGPE